MPVLAFEPSANVIGHLQRSASASGYGDRWHIVAKGAGDAAGRRRFVLSSVGDDVYDGLRSTGRVETAGEVEVEVTTLDDEWGRLGRPAVSVIKIDVEGAETQVLAGAAKCLVDQRPAVLLEWNRSNLAAYGYEAESLLTLARDISCRVYAMPGMVAVSAPIELRAQMTRTESFMLLPA